MVYVVYGKIKRYHYLVLVELKCCIYITLQDLCK